MLGHHELQICQALGGIQGWLNAFGGSKEKIEIEAFYIFKYDF